MVLGVTVVFKCLLTCCCCCCVVGGGGGVGVCGGVILSKKY